MLENLELKQITLVAISSIKIEETVEALKKSMVGIDYYEVVLITHQKPDSLPNNIKFKQSRQINSLADYSKFMLYELADYIDSEFVLVIQYDGYVLRPQKWNNNFLNYDYIGAPWRRGNYFTQEGVAVRVGNGGFSFRSKKLLNVFNELKLPFIEHEVTNCNEDVTICVYHRKELEDYGIKFAPASVASVFSREEKCYDSELEPFGFHIDKRTPIRKLKDFVKKIFSLLHITFIL